MTHLLISRATPDKLAAAEEAADWLIDAIATATQDRKFLRGGQECDADLCEAIRINGVVSALRAMEAIQ